MTNSEKEQIPLLLDEFHNNKCNMHHGINETIHQNKEKDSLQSLTQDVENFIKH